MTHPLITLEGPDGSGKTTLGAALAEALASPAVHRTALPTPRGRIDAGLAPTWQTREGAFMVDRARAWTRVVRPALDSGPVLVDRWTASAYAYWSGDEASAVSALGVATALSAPPTAVVAVDAPLEVRLERIGARGGSDALDPTSVEEHRRISERYECLWALLEPTPSQRSPQPFWRPRPPRQYPGTTPTPLTSSCGCGGLLEAFTGGGPRPVLVRASGVADTSSEVARVLSRLRALGVLD